MIVGKLEDFKEVDFKNPNLRKAFEFIKEHDLLSLPLGKTVIDGDNCYVNRSSYVGKDVKDCKLEGHQNYLDLQLVIKGQEKMGYVDITREGLTISSPYDPVKDKANYVGDVDAYITLHDHQFAIVYPSDIHQPCIKVNDELIEKAVFKIKIA